MFALSVSCWKLAQFQREQWLERQLQVQLADSDLCLF